MAKKKEKKLVEMQDAPVVMETEKKEEKSFFVKPSCKCITPFGILEKDKFVSVSKEQLDHLLKLGIKIERAN